MILPTLTTERLLLEPVRADHARALHQLWTDPDVRRYLWDDETISLDRAAAVIRASVEAAETEGLEMWALYRKVDRDSLIGFAALRHPEQSVDVEILYGLFPEYWRQGFATEASAAVLHYAFDVLHLRRVLAGADAPNTKSFSVVQRLGMVLLEGGVPSVPGAVYFVLEADRAQ